MAHHAVDTLGKQWYPTNVYPDLGLRRIRLLRIGRQSWPPWWPPHKRNIVCIMTEMSLDDPEDPLVYDAVSYAWGDWDDSATITVNGYEIAVTRNLHEALVLFSESSSLHQWLWVDAICINQRNSDERSRQVAMMGEIFKRADTVRVWLGPEAMYTEYCLDELAEFVTDPTMGALSSLPTPDFLLESDSFFEGLQDLARRRWWKRLWTVQEVTLASQVSLHCGKITANFRLVVARLYIFWCSVLQTVASPPRASSRVQPGGLSTQRLTAFYELCGEFLPFISVFRRATDLSSNDVHPRAVIEHLALVSSMQASLSRDRIYGLLGLLPRTLVFAIGIDYEAPADRIYENAAAEIMSWSSSLDLLGLADVVKDGNTVGIQSSQPESLSMWLPNWLRSLAEPAATPVTSRSELSVILPSWVPKWNRSSTLHNPSFWVTSYQAARAIPTLVKFDGAGKLTVRASIVDKVFSVGQTCPIISYAEQVAGVPRTQVIEVLQHWRSLYAMMSGTLLEEAQIISFWRTLTMDRIFQNDLLSRRRWSKGDLWQGMMFETWLNHPDSLELFANEAAKNRLRSNILGALAKRTFFISGGKRPGVVQCGADELQEQDVIALLAGLHMPAVLRPQAEGYEFVAPCYVDGLMYGEAAGLAADFCEITLI